MLEAPWSWWGRSGAGRHAEFAGEPGWQPAGWCLGLPLQWPELSSCHGRACGGSEDWCLGERSTSCYLGMWWTTCGMRKIVANEAGFVQLNLTTLISNHFHKALVLNVFHYIPLLFRQRSVFILNNLFIKRNVNRTTLPKDFSNINLNVYTVSIGHNHLQYWPR